MTARFDRLDLGLLALGLLGLVLFAALLPAQHPDGAASYGLGREQAVAAARGVLERQGYATDGLVPRARLTRASRLLDSLQHGLGRRETVRLLREDDALPAHYWRVEWRKSTRNGALFGSAGSLAFSVLLTEDGRPWELLNPQAVMPGAGVDRDVLRALLAADPEMGAALTASPDSALGALLHFDLSGASRLTDSVALAHADRERLYAAATTGRPQGLGEAAAAEIARQHLASTALSGYPLAVASVETLPERGRAAARVRFETTERVHGQRVAVASDVTAAGALLQLETTFNEEAEAEEITGGNVSVQLGPSGTARGAARWIGYIGLVLALLVVMFRRLSARALDARAALKDALLAGALAMAATMLAAPLFIAEMGVGWELMLFLGIGMLFSGAGIGLLVLVASSASDALTRAVWPEQIATLSLVRQGAWVNQPVGRALVRGAAVAGLLVGLATLLLVLFPDAALYVGGGDRSAFGAESSLSVFAISLAQRGWQALALVLAGFVGLGAMVRRWRPGLVVPGLAAGLAALGPGTVPLPAGSALVTWGAALAVGLVLALLYRRYDALTVLVGLVLAGVLWDTTEGWLVEASPAWLDAVLGGALLVGTAALGLAGVRSGRAGDALPRYVPDYVVEQRERGRLQRELEIAREVQRSFLPARMPDVPGLDLAAACIAAEEVGGDYYDVIPLSGRRLALVIGDVSGKGIQAAFFMTLAKGFLQSLARETESPAEVLRRANRLFFANAPRGTFVSLIYAVLDLDARTLTFARAGHNPVILRRSPERTTAFVQPPGLALGLAPRTVFDETIREETIALRPGDTLVFYTDGFSEAMDPAKRLYTDERLAAAVAAHSDAAATDLLQALVDDVARHAGPADQHDDMTMLVVRIGEDGATHHDGAARSLGAPISPAAR